MMYRWVLIIWALSLLPVIDAGAQNTSNKGKEFWIAYAGHIDDVSSRMYLYITSDVNTSAEVKIGGQTIPGSPFSITANQIQAVPISASAYVGSSDVKELGKAIQVTGEQPIVVYAHIFKAARSGATLVLPAKVLGREYYTANYTQNKPGANNLGSAYSEFTIVGVEDNTLIEITPKAKEVNNQRAAGQPFQIILNKGEIYQYQSETDLSGSHILSKAGDDGICKPIAVFSGSTWVGFCGENNPSTTGGDNLYQQLYPVSAWGKEFITAPFIRKPYDIFRVYFSKDNTTLSINGIVQGGPFNKGGYYEFISAEGTVVKASEPISLVQYQISQSCDPLNNGYGNNNAPNPGDPEMTILNPVEQTLSQITVYSARRNQTNPATNIVRHYINIVIRAEFKSSFTINGLAPEGVFVPIGNTDYVYLQEDVTERSEANPTHTLMADGGFSAIAYGYGGVESYGYLAGADAKNLYENLQVYDASTMLSKSDVCVGETAAFKLVLPFMPLRITWTIDSQSEFPIDFPVASGSELINGVTVYTFEYDKTIRYTGPGVHQIKATVINPAPSGCDPVQDIVTDFNVYGIPESKFSINTTETCAGAAVTFTDESGAAGENIVKWHWDFGDGNGVVIKRSAAPFLHAYTTPGTYQVTLFVESGSGCMSPQTDPVTIIVNKLPVADFKFSTPSCETREISFTDLSVVEEGAIVKWNWNFGDVNAEPDGSGTSTDQHPAHIFSAPGTYTVTLTVETDKGCAPSIVSTRQVVISPLPTVDFETPDVCVNDVAAVFINKSANAGGTTTNLTYLWDFDDPGSGAANASTEAEGKHKYTNAGEYRVSLTVTTAEGCVVTTFKTFRVNGATPVAAFEVLNADQLCANREILVKDNSTIAGSDKITRIEWYIDNVKVAEKQHPLINDTYALNVPVFSSPLTKTSRLKLIAYSGDLSGPCQNTLEVPITIHAIPDLKFEAPAPICVNAGTIRIVAEEMANVPGTGQFSGKAISPDGVFNPLRAGVGTWEITYTYNSDQGCVALKKQNIVVKPIPQVQIEREIFAFIDGTVQVKAFASDPDLRFKWTPSKGLSRDDILRPVITADDDRVYKLSVTNALGCEETMLMRLIVLREIKPPNAFSPNGDGVNDVWKLNYLESYPKATVDIFNRYGEKIFFSQGYSIPFDGTFKGGPLPVGTYYYMINPGNGKKTIKGSLTLIR